MTSTPRTVKDIPLDLTPAQMYVQVEAALNPSDTTPDIEAYLRDIAAMLDGVDMLYQLDGLSRRDVITLFSVFDTMRKGPLVDALRSGARYVQTSPPTRQDGTRVYGEIVAAGLLAIADRFAAVLEQAHADRDGQVTR